MKLIGLAVLMVGAGYTQDMEPRYIPQYETMNWTIALGQHIVRAGGADWYKINVPPRCGDSAHVEGAFRAFGGTGNDVIAVVTDEVGLNNIVNGHGARVWYHTPGRQTQDKFDIPLVIPDTYYFVFSNRFSPFTAKQITVAIRLSCQYEVETPKGE